MIGAMFIYISRNLVGIHCIGTGRNDIFSVVARYISTSDNWHVGLKLQIRASDVEKAINTH